MLEQGMEGVGENLIRAVAYEHLLRRNMVVGRDRLAQIGSARIGVEPQPIGCGCDRSHDARLRRVMILVGIELDDTINLWLLTGHVWRQAVNDWTPEAAHDLRPNDGTHHSRLCQALVKVRSSPDADPGDGHSRIAAEMFERPAGAAACCLSSDASPSLLSGPGKIAFTPRPHQAQARRHLHGDRKLPSCPANC